MYQKYQTEAIVLNSYPLGEADKTCVLYTRDFGLVRARASGARKETSKMRYALQHYSRATVGLVRGVRGWRLAGAIALDSAAHKDSAGVRAFARISELVAKLVIGEEENPYLYETLSQTHEALLQETCEASATIEVVAVARILYSLGYISAEALETTLLSHTTYSIEHLAEAETIKDALLLSINRALNETHL
ncbi:DNA repair protein RecO [Candidatus Kaiserbacteria bacterium]|nr:DNA repair protein RecO [Candidatus Kaiserbacteria bacterium]